MFGATRYASRNSGQLIRRFHAAKSVKNPEKIDFDVVNADVGKIGTSYFHMLNLGLLAAFPLVVAAPGIISRPIEVALCLAFPVHAHVSMAYVISDYIPRPFQRIAKVGMLGATAVVTLGLLRLSLAGPGLVNSMMSLWKKPEEKKEAETS